MRSFLISSADPSTSLHNFNKLAITAPGHGNHGSSSDQITISSVTVRHHTPISPTIREQPTSPSSVQASSGKSSVFSLFSKMPIPSTSKRINRLKSGHIHTVTSQSTTSLTRDTPDLTLEQRTEAVRAAKTILRTVRNDWEFPQSCPPRKPTKPRTTSAVSNGKRSSPARSPPKEEEKTSIERDLLDALNLKDESEYDDSSEEEEEDDEDDLEWRDREESDTDVDVDQPKPNNISAYANENTKSPYRYNAPDSVGENLNEDERKARRLAAQSEEMGWNKGLKNYIEQRDAWTGADKEGKIKVCKSKFAEVCDFLLIYIHGTDH